MTTTWYQFIDMHSGGSRKTPYNSIYIEAFSETEACNIFFNIYKRNPYHVTCECCGPDYVIHDYLSFDEITQNKLNYFSFAVHRCFY